MAIVTVDDVRDVLNVTDSDVPDDKVLKMIKRAEVTLELETSTEIDYSACSDAEKEAITVLAALYALCFLTGGSAIGWNFSAGELNASASPKAPSFDVLLGEFNRLLEKLKTPPPYVVSA